MKIMRRQPRSNALNGRRVTAQGKARCAAALGMGSAAQGKAHCAAALGTGSAALGLEVLLNKKESVQ